tara:strand:+ start:495 stop:797 length:303 start_codon:yes stop_codon:yes gene_type:complete
LVKGGKEAAKQVVESWEVVKPVPSALMEKEGCFVAQWAVTSRPVEASAEKVVAMRASQPKEVGAARRVTGGEEEEERVAAAWAVVVVVVGRVLVTRVEAA